MADSKNNSGQTAQRDFIHLAIEENQELLNDFVGKDFIISTLPK